MRWPALALAVVCAAGCAEGVSLQPPLVQPLALASAPSVSPAAISLVRSVGAPGAGPGRFREPSGIAVGVAGELYVADTGSHRVQVLSPDGAPRAVLGAFGWDAGEFDAPTALALRPGARPMLYIAERGGRRVQVCDLNNEQYRVVLEDAADARLDPTALAIGRRGELYVTDAASHRVWSMSADGEVEWIRGGFGHGLDRLNYPTGIAVSARGGILVSDTANGRLARMDFAGATIGTWRPEGIGSPAGVAWSAGRWYVCEPAAGRVVVLNDDGVALTTFGRADLTEPSGIAAAGGFIYVSDRAAHDIKVFRVIEPSVHD